MAMHALLLETKHNHYNNNDNEEVLYFIVDKFGI